MITYYSNARGKDVANLIAFHFKNNLITVTKQTHKMTHSEDRGGDVNAGRSR